jgi:hypothetical protein
MTYTYTEPQPAEPSAPAPSGESPTTAELVRQGVAEKQAAAEKNAEDRARFVRDHTVTAPAGDDG